jgi:MFS family permease
LFYGWVIVAGVFLAQFFMTGFFTYGFPLLVDPVQREFDASVTQVQLGLSAGSLVGAVLAPVFGPLADRWSARGMILIGAVALIASLLLMSISTSVVWFSVVMATLISCANLLLGPITGSTIVSRWFAEARGRALGVAATGTSAGGAIIPLLFGSWIVSMGWRGALQALAVCVAILVVPLFVFAVKDDPSQAGLFPDGADSAPPATAASAAASRPWTTTEVLRSRSYWLISCSLGLLFVAYVGLLANLHKYATTLGVEVDSASLLISLIAVSGFVGKLIFGWAADRMSLRAGLWTAQALAATGVALFSLEPEFPVMLVAAVFMGLAAGGMLPVWGAMVAAAFGTASYGRVMGLIMPVISLFTFPGPILAATSMDVTGSYQLALRGFVVAIVAASILLVPLRLETTRDDGGATA